MRVMNVVGKCRHEDLSETITVAKRNDYLHRNGKDRGYKLRMSLRIISKLLNQ